MCVRPWRHGQPSTGDTPHLREAREARPCRDRCPADGATRPSLSPLCTTDGVCPGHGLWQLRQIRWHPTCVLALILAGVQCRKLSLGMLLRGVPAHHLSVMVFDHRPRFVVRPIVAFADVVWHVLFRSSHSPISSRTTFAGLRPRRTAVVWSPKYIPPGSRTSYVTLGCSGSMRGLPTGICT